MTLVDVLHRYYDRFKRKHGDHTTPDQWSALNAMLGCRTGQYGEMALRCVHCGWSGQVPQSCGHRACTQCHHHATVQWLERQQRKLLPVDYFMVTFTLPRELRTLARTHQTTVYSRMFAAASETLKAFGHRDKHLAGELGMTCVLHTHSRRLDYHPHLHFIVPAGGLNKGRREWRKACGKYLFKQNNLAKVFRGCLLKALRDEGLPLPATPRKWVVDCTHVGRGLPALKYLSRYLYRGIISDRQIIGDDGQYITFSYTDSTGKHQERTLPGEDFIALLVQHTLPKGFRRVRDYGFLHGNAKSWLQRLQCWLKVRVAPPILTARPAFPCRVCRHPLDIVGFIRPGIRPG